MGFEILSSSAQKSERQKASAMATLLLSAFRTGKLSSAKHSEPLDFWTESTKKFLKDLGTRSFEQRRWCHFVLRRRAPRLANPSLL